MFIDEATINGYVKDLTVLSPSHDRKRKHFEFTLQASDDEQRVFCFNPEKHKPLSKIHQAETGCALKRYKLNDKNEMIVNDNDAITLPCYNEVTLLNYSKER